MTEDAVQLNILVKNQKLSEISPNDLLQLFSKYLKQEMKQNFDNGLSDEEFYAITTNLLEQPNKFSVGQISREDFYQARIKAWNLHDAEDDLLKKHILRAIVSCLYEKSLEPNEDGKTYNLVELYLSLLLDIDEVYCQKFRVFLEKALKLA
ncbi:hypothetical protein J0953_001866 [Listeria monocytogenes]|nr:hypothetical protein [Listeria monocytogenes]EHG1763258.1 hypothetical protein [Listeria monocytogenes]